MVGGDRRIPSYGGEYRYAREDKDVDVQLLGCCCSSRSLREGVEDVERVERCRAVEM